MNGDNAPNIIISINKEKFGKINSKLINIFKDYYNLIDTYSYEINYIENSINSFKPKNKLNIKNFIDNQQLLIKDLVNIINNLLFSIKIHTNKNSNSKSKKSIKSIIENNNFNNMNYIKNNDTIKLKSKNQVSDSLSFLDIKKKKKETKINQYINKPKEKEKEKDKNELSSKNSSLTNIFSFSTKNKSFLNNSNSLSDINNNITDVNGLYNNYRKSSASPYPKKVNKIRLKLSNYNDKKKEILNTSFQSNKSIKREKSRKSESCKSFDKIPISFSLNSITNIINKSRSKSIVPLKLTDFSLKNERVPYSPFNESNSEENNIKNGVLYIFSDNKNNHNLKKYDLDGKYHINPQRMTKEVLSNSYNILNKYEKKMKKDGFVGKRAKSSLLF